MSTILRPTCDDESTMFAHDDNYLVVLFKTQYPDGTPVWHCQFTDTKHAATTYLPGWSTADAPLAAINGQFGTAFTLPRPPAALWTVEIVTVSPDSGAILCSVTRSRHATRESADAAVFAYANALTVPYRTRQEDDGTASLHYREHGAFVTVEVREMP